MRKVRQNKVSIEHVHYNLTANPNVDSSLKKWFGEVENLCILWERMKECMTCVNSEGEIVGTWSEMNHPLLPKLN